MTQHIENEAIIDERSPKTAYSYAPDTGEYLGITTADPSPLEMDVWHYPANSTDIAPPQKQDAKAIIFKDNAWGFVDDYRGQTWFKQDGTAIIIKELINPAELGFLKEKPIFPEPEIQPIIPESITRRQFFQQAAAAGFISEDEALTGMVGQLPAPMLDVINKLPQDLQFPAKALAIGAQEFERSNLLSGAVAQSLGLSPSDLDQFWLEASKL